MDSEQKERRLCKYDANDANDREFVISLFNDAFNACMYHEYEIERFSNDDVLVGYLLKDEDDAVCNSIMLSNYDNGDFYVCIENQFYRTIYNIKDINAELLSYLFRNTTKVIDEEYSSKTFFLSCKIANDRSKLTAALNDSVIEDTQLAMVVTYFVDATNDTRPATNLA